MCAGSGAERQMEVPTEVRAEASAWLKVSSKVKVLTKVSSKAKSWCWPARPDPMPGVLMARPGPRCGVRPARPEPRREAVDHGRACTRNHEGLAR